MRILILSTTTGYQLRSFGEAAERLGIELAFATDRCRTLDDPWRDRAVPVRFHEEAASVRAIVDAAAVRPVDGVLAVGDRPVRLAALAARALGIDGNPPDAASASANKKTARERFTAAGLPVPWFVELPASADHARLEQVTFPAVVKPLGLSGSRGVIRANTRPELDAAIARVRALLARKDVRALGSGPEDALLVEGYIDGPEFAVEGVLTAGRLQAFAIFEKPDPLNGPFFEETIYVTPPALAPAVQSAILAQVGRATRALGLEHGPVHAECRVAGDGIYILEVAARPIGGLCSRVLRFTPPGGGGLASLEEVLLRHAAGEDITAYARERRAAAVMMIPIPKRGILKKVEGVEPAREIPGIEDVRVTAKVDQLLEPLPEAGSYLGFIFARTDRPADAVVALRAAHGALRFIVDAPIPVRAVS